MNRSQLLRSAAALGAAPLALPALAARASAAPRAAVPVTTQLMWIENVEYAGYWIADANGWFAAEGVAPAFLPGGPNLASVEAIVAAGRADVGVDELEKIVDAVSRGADLVVAGAIYQRAIAGLLSLPKNPVRKAADLVGKRIGFAPRDKEYIDGIFALNHLEPRYVEVPVGFDPAPLVEGACDAYLCYMTAQPLVLAQKKIPYVLVSFADLGYASYAGAIFCTRGFASTRRAALTGYLRALGRGWLENARDPRPGAELAVRRYGASLGLDLDQQIAQNRAQIPLTESPLTRRFGPLWISADEVEHRVYRTLRALGRTNLPEPSRLLELGPLREANEKRR